MCFGLFIVVTSNCALAEIVSCSFYCPENSEGVLTEETVTAEGSVITNDMCSEALSSCEGYTPSDDDLADFCTGASIYTFLENCTCDADETFNADRRVCLESGARPDTPVEPPDTPVEPTETSTEKKAEPKTYKAIPVKGIDLPTEMMITADIPTLIGQVIKAVLGIVGSIALLMFIYGGFLWLMSAGSPERVAKGKNVLIWASVGLVVIFVSYALVNFVIGSLAGAGGKQGASSTVQNRCCCDESGEAEGVSSARECSAMGAIGSEECEWVEVSRCPSG